MTGAHEKSSWAPGCEASPRKGEGNGKRRSTRALSSSQPGHVVARVERSSRFFVLVPSFRIGLRDHVTLPATWYVAAIFFPHFHSVPMVTSNCELEIFPINIILYFIIQNQFIWI